MNTINDYQAMQAFINSSKELSITISAIGMHDNRNPTNFSDSDLVVYLQGTVTCDDFTKIFNVSAYRKPWSKDWVLREAKDNNPMPVPIPIYLSIAPMFSPSELEDTELKKEVDATIDRIAKACIQHGKKYANNLKPLMNQTRFA